MEVLLFAIATLVISICFTMFSWKHVIFKLFILLSWMIFYLSPFLNSNYVDRQSEYLIEPRLVILFVFFVPLTYFYFKLNCSINNENRLSQNNLIELRVSTRAYSYILFIFTVISYYVILNNGFLYLRVGYKELAQTLLDLDIISHSVLRINEDVAPFFTAFNIFILFFLKINTFDKLLISISSLLIAVFIFINSRYDVLVMTLMLFMLFLSIKYEYRFNLKRKFIYVALPILLIIFVSLIRNYYENTYVKEIAISQTFSKSQWLERIDGISLINNINEKSAYKGFMLGEAWSPVLLYYYMIFNKERYKELKLNLKTNSKVIIYKYYNGVDVADLTSSYLSDIYANFSYYGIFIFSFIFASIISICERYTRPERYGSLGFVIAMWCVFRLFYVNNDFITMLLNFIKFLPIVVIFAYLYPVKGRINKRLILGFS